MVEQQENKDDLNLQTNEEIAKREGRSKGTPVKCQMCNNDRVRIAEVTFSNGQTKISCENCAFLYNVYILLTEPDNDFDSKLEIISKLAPFFNYKKGSKWSVIISGLFKYLYDERKNPIRSELKKLYSRHFSNFNDVKFDRIINKLQMMHLLGQYTQETDTYEWGKFVIDVNSRFLTSLQTQNREEYFHQRGNVIKSLEAISGLINALFPEDVSDPNSQSSPYDPYRVAIWKQIMLENTNQKGELKEECKQWQPKDPFFHCTYQKKISDNSIKFKEITFQDEVISQELDDSEICNETFQSEEEIIQHLKQAHNCSSDFNEYIYRNKELAGILVEQNRLKKKIAKYKDPIPFSKILIELEKDRDLVRGFANENMYIFDPKTMIIFEKAFIKTKEIVKEKAKEKTA